nr:MAG TPA: hypothetical protein [Caudoviricetes sp.]
MIMSEVNSRAMILFFHSILIFILIRIKYTF